LEDFMATGTSADFWVDKELPAILKHEILKCYVPKFVAKLSSTNRKVVLIDGYAGMGRYVSGQAGSAIQMLEIAKSLVAKRSREVDVYLVERDPETFARLQTEVEEFLRVERLNVFLIQGDIGDRLSEVLARAEGMPLFLFLDPCGLGLDFGDLTDALTTYRPRTMTTEILLNFSAEAVRRIGGLVPTPEKHATALARMDGVVGGPWWRKAYSGDFDKEGAEHEVVLGYISRLGEKTGMATFAVDAKRKLHHKPLYYLVFGTRHPDGVWFFADAVARSAKKWRETLAAREEEERPTLVGIIETQEELNNKLEERACEAIQENILELLETHGDFVVGKYPGEVFGAFFGEVTEKVVRRAIKELKSKGLTSSPGEGPRIDQIEVTRPS
jgi:three-Cys-motif partner protein